MRGKNIFAELPVEETSESENTLKIISLDSKGRRNPRNRNKNRKTEVSKTTDSPHIEDLSKLSISEMVQKQHNDMKKAAESVKEVASIVHKKVTGANNWNAFLEATENKEDNICLNLESEDESLKFQKLKSCVAIDCEMVGIGDGGKESMLARVSIVDSLGECLYDTFVKPTAAIVDYRTPFSGVRPADLVNAEKFTAVQKKVLELIRGKVLVGHAVHNDLIVLKIRHPRRDVRDTSSFKKFYSIGSGTPSLKRLTSHFLKVDIQCGEHNSIQDAQAAMQLYMMFRKEWEVDIKKRRHLHYHQQHHHTKKKTKPSHKPKRFGKNYKK